MEESSKSEEAPPKLEQAEFKKPVLFGRIGKLPKKIKQDAEKSTMENIAEKPVAKVEHESPKSALPPAVLYKELTTPIPYKEPKWSGLCPDGTDYGLEVLKSGMIVEKVDLTNKSYYVFGRLANCDVVMAHPTISRHHCVLQYKAFAEEGEPPCGWYLFDLGSTHGTFLNKERLKASHYTRVRVGHQIRFGNSTRTYIVLGPDFDCEGESELSVSEIKQRARNMKLERDRMIQEDKEKRERDRLEEEKKREEQGIDWGMGEDAEDEPDLADNPYAVTANEELYLEDPKKTLRGYFEREGHELSYDCEERGVGQFMCRVELPLDDARGNPVMAEVMHRGKKKEAVVACALEACRILDRAGLLRQSKHESRRRKQRDWSADDYYDSDDDTFLDRTGGVEDKRRKRMRRLGAAGEESDKPLTHDDLLKQIATIEQKIASEQRTLDSLRNARTPAPLDAETDALDAYMEALKDQKQSVAQKADISKAKMAIQKLKSELSKTQRLAEIARPAHLPPLVKKDDSKMAIKVGSNSVVYGKRIRLKEDAERKPKVRKEVKQEEEEFVEEVESDEESTEEKKTEDKDHKSEKDSDDQERNENNETDKVEKSKKINTSNESKKDKKRTKEKNTEDKEQETDGKSEKDRDNQERDENSETDKVEDNKKNNASDKSKEDKKCMKEKKVYGPMRPPENYVIPESYFDQESDRDLPEITETE